MENFKIGDRVTIIGNSKSSNGRHGFEEGSEGTILKVKEGNEYLVRATYRWGSEVDQTIEGVNLKTMEKFKIGDKVKVVSHTKVGPFVHRFAIGTELTITNIHTYEGYDNYSCSSKERVNGSSNWNVLGVDLEKVKTENMEQEFKVTRERVLDAASKCSTAKATLQVLFPEAFEDSSILKEALKTFKEELKLRDSGTYKNTGFYLPSVLAGTLVKYKVVIDNAGLYTLVITKAE